jgi:hypothetical protein
MEEACLDGVFDYANPYPLGSSEASNGRKVGSLR